MTRTMKVKMVMVAVDTFAFGINVSDVVPNRVENWLLYELDSLIYIDVPSRSHVSLHDVHKASQCYPSHHTQKR